MIWTWLRLFKFFNKIGNYFYYKHVSSLREKQVKNGLR